MLFSSCCLQENLIAIPIYSSTWCGWFQISLLPTSHRSKHTNSTYWGRKTWCSKNVALAHFFNEKKRVKQEAQAKLFRAAVLQKKAQLSGEVLFGHPKQCSSCRPWVVATELAPGPRAESQQVWERESKNICGFAILRRMDFVPGTI